MTSCPIRPQDSQTKTTILNDVCVRSMPFMRRAIFICFIKRFQLFLLFLFSTALSERILPFNVELRANQNIEWAAPSEFVTYRLCEQRRFRRACASAQSRQNLRCSLIQAVSQEEPSDRKPDPWPLWMAGHAQLKFVMTECSKTQIRLARLKWKNLSFDVDLQAIVTANERILSFKMLRLLENQYQIKDSFIQCIKWKILSFNVTFACNSTLQERILSCNAVISFKVVTKGKWH